MSVFRDSFEQCPRCGIDLIDAMSARGCQRCRGLWLAEAVLTEMVMTMLPVAMHGRLVFATITPDGNRIGCPSCHDAMELAMLHGIVVDRCAKHGIWFDADELQDVLRRTARPDGASILGETEAEPDPPWATLQPAPPPPPPEPTTAAEPAPRAGVPALRFHIVRGDTVRDLTIRREIIKLGRMPSAHVRLPDDSGAARMHAVIEAATAEDVSIIDLGADRATEVNGERITRVQLQSGDVITIGDSYVTVEILP